MTGLVYRKLRAPQQDGEQFLEPPISDFPRLWEQNRRLSSQSWSIPHKSLRQMMLDARLELLQLAGVPRSPITGGLPPVVMTGHQPELFHPGVWCKNFVVGELAKRVGAAAIHVVMDNDAAGDPAIKIPDFNGRSWHQKRVAYDVTVAAVPHEQRFPVDRRLFDTFGTRVAASIEPLVSNPLVREMWPTAVSTADQGLVRFDNTSRPRNGFIVGLNGATACECDGSVPPMATRGFSFAGPCMKRSAAFPRCR